MHLLSEDFATRALLGVAIGDAVGVPYEFRSRETMLADPAQDMTGYGTHRQPAGTWSDDSALMFCLAESLVQGYDLIDMGRRMVNWYLVGYWSAHGEVFDIGITTARALREIEPLVATGDLAALRERRLHGTPQDNGNGSLMRILPLLFHLRSLPIDEQFDCIWEVSALTHRHIRAAVACLLYLRLAGYLLEGRDKAAAYAAARADLQVFCESHAGARAERYHFARLLEADIAQLDASALRGSGYVVESLEASLWCLLRHDSYAGVVLAAVNLGEDTDTTAAIAGGWPGCTTAVPPYRPPGWTASPGRAISLRWRSVCACGTACEHCAAGKYTVFSCGRYRRECVYLANEITLTTCFSMKFILHAEELTALQAYMLERKWIAPAEHLISASKPGEGNMNYTLRIRTNFRTFIIKQSRDYVEKYPQIPAPAERAVIEGRFYELIQEHETLRSCTPEVSYIDADNSIIILEDLGESSDFSFIYDPGKEILPAEIEALAAFLSVLHNEVQPQPGGPDLSNRNMRALNAEHIFDYPFRDDSGFDLDAITPGLQAAAAPYQTDRRFKERVRAIGGTYYLSDGPTLLHGDFYPGSWLRTLDGVRVIDPEFCFWGRAEFDLGVMIAHLRMARQAPSRTSLLMQRYQPPRGFDLQLLHQLAGIEIMRRLIGLAQLPLSLSLDQKVELLDEAYAWILD